MAAKLQEITAVYRREKIRFDGSNTAILECKEPEAAEPQRQLVAVAAGETESPAAAGSYADRFNDLLAAGPAGIIVKLECEPDELTSGLTYRFYGRWTTHERHGRQFHATGGFFRSQPHGQAGTIRYLTATCAGCGVGSATAHKLWEAFGGDAVRILREQPDVAVAAVGMSHFTEDKASAASAVLKRESRLEAITIDLIDQLGGRGFPRDTVKKCIAEWGGDALKWVKKGYPLQRFRGCSFLRCDKLYTDNGGDPGSLKRQAYAAWFSVARDTEGNTWHKPQDVENGLRDKIGTANLPVPRGEIQGIPAILLAKRARMLTVMRDGSGEPWIAETRKAANERTIADHVRAMLTAPCQWPGVDGIGGTDHQMDEIDQALRTSIAILSGSPGVGKTWITTRYIKRIVEVCGRDSVACAAPTGKAATRLSDVLESCDVGLRASTIHRLLGIASRTAGDGWGFVHDESNPLPYKFLVIDEASMVSANLLAALLLACGRGTHVLLVGDPNQLPPIEHGRPLYDMIAAGVPTGRLTEIHRNAGSIVRICAAIRDGQPWSFDTELDPDAGRNLKLVATRSNAASQERIVETLKKLPSLGLDPVWDCQVLVSVNQRSELSRVEINKLLQGVLNPNGKQVAGCPFRIGDKIIRVKRNTLMPCYNGDDDCNRDAADGKVLVCNGEMGRVTGVESKRAFARFTAPDRSIVIPFGDRRDDGDEDEDTGTGCDFDLGYGCTVHKFQGSESRVILYGLDDSGGAMRLGSRELFYTGISRGKQFGLCYGKEFTAKAMCLKQVLTRRKTFLRELIRGEIA